MVTLLLLLTKSNNDFYHSEFFPSFFFVFLFNNFNFIYNFSLRGYIIKTSNIIPYKASEIESIEAKVNNRISDENDENVIKSLYYDLNEQ